MELAMETIRSQFVGCSASFREMVDLIGKIAPSSAHVLIQGETGTGKELVARTLHYASGRRRGPFVPVNCAGIPEMLMESELFGHEKGAFTDARSARRGLVAEADRGTLFLDEIDSLSPKGQATLLRFLQDAEYRPVGSAVLRSADVRIVAATNADLEAGVRQRLFREDLFYRLNALSIEVPPLRERRADIPLLTDYFLERHREPHEPAIRVDDQARAALLAYPWPGNVRELENVVLRGVVLAEQGCLCLPERIHAATRGQALPDANYRGSMRGVCQRELRKVEERYLRWLLHETNGNISEAARRAATDRRHIGRKLKQLGIDVATER
jgi:DNA-binding NtrC family response regulator